MSALSLLSTLSCQVLRTPLHIAVDANSLGCVNTLLAAKADANATTFVSVALTLSHAHIHTLSHLGPHHTYISRCELQGGWTAFLI